MTVILTRLKCQLRVIPDLLTILVEMTQKHILKCLECARKRQESSSSGWDDVTVVPAPL